MTAREAAEWKYFLRLCGPVGYERTDWGFASVAQAVVTSITGERRPTGEFLLKFGGGDKQEENPLVNNCMRLAGL